jgi:hypothetical protein
MSDNAVASGSLVAEHLNDGDIPEEQIQPNGVDLTIGEVFRSSGQPGSRSLATRSRTERGLCRKTPASTGSLKGRTPSSTPRR